MHASQGATEGAAAALTLSLKSRAGGSGEQPTVEHLGAELERLEALSRRCSTLRLLSFGAFALGLLGGLESALYPLFISLPALTVFAAVFFLHGRHLDRKQALEDKRTLLLEARERRSTRRRERLPPPVPPEPGPLEEGRRVFAPEPESFSLDPWIVDDLDLLRGPRTLFAFLDWSSSAFGSRRLRHMMLHPLLRGEDLRARQQAVVEAASRGDVRHELLAALLPLRRHDLKPLARLFGEAPAFAARKALLIWTNILGTLAPLSLLAVVVTGMLELLAAVFILVILNLFTIARFVKEANAARDRLILLGPLLDACLRLSPLMEKAGLQAAAWREIATTFGAMEPHARKLKRYISFLEFHSYGVIYEIVNALTLWELRILPLAAALFARHRRSIEDAAGALGEGEALLSLSLPLVEQEGFSLPELLDGARPVVEAEKMGHPLLEPGTAVRNPLSLGRGTSVWIVTGSNMSGKSTFLKAAGVNLILAGMGGPVCAGNFRWTPLAIYSDINVRDSLDDGKSYFQVEVERVLDVIRAARQSPMLLGIFDELFRGTNSVERVAIARAVIRHLRSAGALLLVATHDKSVAELASIDHEPGMENRHLEETVEDGLMRFDYRLRQGEARTRNAIRVLELQGYPREIIDEARRRAPEEGEQGAAD